MCAKVCENKCRCMSVCVRQRLLVCVRVCVPWLSVGDRASENWLLTPGTQWQGHQSHGMAPWEHVWL